MDIFSSFKRKIKLVIGQAKDEGQKRLMEILSRFLVLILVVFLILISLPFLGIALALVLGEVFSSYTIGFLLVGLIFVVVLVVLLFLMKKFQKWIVIYLIKWISKK